MLGENHFSVYTGITLSQEWFLKFKYPWVLISSKVIRISACVSFTDWLVDDGSNLCSLVPVLMGYFLLWSICLGHFHGSFSSSCFGKLYLLFILLPCLNMTDSQLRVLLCWTGEMKEKLVIFWRFFLVFQYNFWVFILSVLGMLNRVRSDTEPFADLLMIMDVHFNINPLNCIIFKPTFL